MLSRETVVLVTAKLYRGRFGQVFLGRWVCRILREHAGSVKDYSYLVTLPAEKRMGDLRGASKLCRTAKKLVEIGNTSGILSSCQSLGDNLHTLAGGWLL